MTNPTEEKEVKINNTVKVTIRIPEIDLVTNHEIRNIIREIQRTWPVKETEASISGELDEVVISGTALKKPGVALETLARTIEFRVATAFPLNLPSFHLCVQTMEDTSTRVISLNEYYKTYPVLHSKLLREKKDAYNFNSI